VRTISHDETILEFRECVDRPYSFRVISQMGKQKPVLTAGPTRNIHWPLPYGTAPQRVQNRSPLQNTFRPSYSLPCAKFLMHSASASSLSRHNLTNNPLVTRSISPSATSHSNIGIISRDVAFSDCSFQN